jgi:hypothetical protein
LEKPERKIRGVILLDAWRRLNFPELKRKAMELYEHWRPTSLVVEAKATGRSLIQELHATGVRYIEAMPLKRVRRSVDPRHRNFRLARLRPMCRGNRVEQ